MAPGGTWSAMLKLSPPKACCCVHHVGPSFHTHGAWSFGNFCRSFSLRFCRNKREQMSHVMVQCVNNHHLLLSFRRLSLDVRLLISNLFVCELTTNLAPLIEFFRTALSHPDRFICTHKLTHSNSVFSFPFLPCPFFPYLLLSSNFPYHLLSFCTS